MTHITYMMFTVQVRQYFQQLLQNVFLQDIDSLYRRQTALFNRCCEQLREIYQPSLDVQPPSRSPEAPSTEQFNDRDEIQVDASGIQQPNSSTQWVTLKIGALF